MTTIAQSVTGAFMPMPVIISQPVSIPIFVSEPRAKDFLKRAASVFDVRSAEFYETERRGTAVVAEIRRAVAYRLRHETKLSLHAIARIIGCDNHTSVVYATKRAAEQLRDRKEKDMQFVSIYERIKSMPLLQAVAS